MNSLRTSLAVAAAFAAAGSLAPAVTLSAQGAAATVPAVATARSAAVATAQAGADDARQSLGLGSSEKLVVKDVVTDRDGTRHVRYERTYRGLRVIGGDFIAHGGSTNDVTWNAGKDLTVATTTPSVSTATATAAGQKRAAASARPRSSQGELVVYATRGQKPRLAYEVVTEGIRADQTPSRIITLVDATTGKTISAQETIVTGTGTGIYNGRVSLGTSGSSGSYKLQDSHGDTTTDMNNGTSGSGTLFTDADDVWGDGSVSNRQSAAVDAHYGATTTFDYYKSQQGRAGIWGDGRGARSRVHYGDSYANAFWDGTQMTYGDGEGNRNPLTELDVASHEMTHGVTANTAGLIYSGDAGGLNEATSDIFGTAVEWYANNPSDTPDYFMGEEIDLMGDGSPLRYMDKPSKDGKSPDCWSSSVPGLNPHYSSGPLNHWFYLASEGSGAKTINGVSYNSPTCNGQAVTPIGRDKAAKIWFRTLSTYLTSGSTYKDARDGAIRSAKDLYGSDLTVCQGIEKTFSAINVAPGSQSCGGGTPDPEPPTGGNLLKNPGFESGSTSWTGTSGPITNNSGRPAHSGTWKLWLGGNGSSATETESQTVTIPATASKAALSYWLRSDTDEGTSGAYDTMKVQVVSGGVTTTLATYSNQSTSTTYSQKSFDLSAYKGKSVTVKFLMTEDSSLQTSFVVDDTAVTTG